MNVLSNMPLSRRLPTIVVIIAFLGVVVVAIAGYMVSSSIVYERTTSQPTAISRLSAERAKEYLGL